MRPEPPTKPYRLGFVHDEACYESAPDPREIEWVCDEGHWLAWEIPAGQTSRCPVIFHDKDSDGRCFGTLKRPDCLCRESGARM